MLMSAAAAIGVLIANLCVEREPLYGLGEWAARVRPGLLGLSADEVELLNDDRVGRALDQLFDCDRASLLTELVLGAICEFQIDCSQLHNDSTSITLLWRLPAGRRSQARRPEHDRRRGADTARSTAAI